MKKGLAKSYWLLIAVLLIVGMIWIFFKIQWEVRSNITHKSGTTVPDARYVGREHCIECHEPEYGNWLNSHHDRAMESATDQTVLGDFNNTEFTYFDVTSRFFKRNGDFLVLTDGADGTLQEFKIEYTFGFDPLQQYLIKFPGGRYQVLGIAWDSRSKEKGGQKWFHLYPDQNITYKDNLHWTGINQNWNYMCAECHSTELRKNYNPLDKSYETTWSEVNVSCEACHGPGSNHIAWANREILDQAVADKGLVVDLGEDSDRAGNRFSGKKHPDQEGYVTNHSEVETCARCHSRRGIFSENYQHGKPLLDTHRLSLLNPDLYYPDGQIRDEVYVYGSFIQSKMYHAGVTCSDCHDPHSLKLKAQGNDLCLNCHQAGTFNTSRHHFHQSGSKGALCVECHMPETTYMVIDPRRDHSIRIPRPDLSLTTGAPNACNQCHKDKAAKWSADRMIKWYGYQPEGFQQYAETFNAANHHLTGAEMLLAAVVADDKTPVIARSTALNMLRGYPGPTALKQIPVGISSGNPMMRLSALTALEGFPWQTRIHYAAGLLDDSILAVRMEAVRILSDIPIHQFTESRRIIFKNAAEEYIAALMINADRPEAQMSLGLHYTSRGMWADAQKSYELARELDPSFVEVYVNLADLMRLQSRDEDGEKLLRKALFLEPENSDVHHALGLFLVRQKRMSEAVAALKRAAELAPENERYIFVYAVSLQSTGQIDKAISVLEQDLELHPANLNTLYYLTTFNLEAAIANSEPSRIDAAKSYLTKLLALAPKDPRVKQLLAQIQMMQ